MRTPQRPPDDKTVVRTAADRAELARLLLDDAAAAEAVADLNRKYLHWDEFRYRPVPRGCRHELLWVLAGKVRATTMRRFDLCGTDFRFSVPEQMQRRLSSLDARLGMCGPGWVAIPGQERERYLAGSLMEEAIASSQLEGASTTRKVAKEMLRRSRAPRNRAERMILNNYQTVRRVQELRDEPITVKKILELHAIVTKGTLEREDEADRLRTTDDIRVVERLSGEVIYSPPQARLLPDSLQALCRLANDDGAVGAVHPFVKASMIHFLIGYLHPFTDGNGRTARALFYWHMLRKGYWQAEYLSISRILLKAPLRYARAYQYSETDGNDLTYFVLHQLEVMEKALDDLDAYLGRKAKERGQALALLDIPGLNERQAEILGWLRKEPGRLLGIREVQNVFGVVYQTARTDLLGLEKLGLLQRKIIGRKEFVFTGAEGFEGRIREAYRPDKMK